MRQLLITDQFASALSQYEAGFREGVVPLRPPLPGRASWRSWESGCGQSRLCVGGNSMSLTDRLRDLVIEFSLPEADYGARLRGLVLLMAWPDEQVGLVAEPLPAESHGWRLFACNPADEGSLRSAVGALAVALGYGAVVEAPGAGAGAEAGTGAGSGPSAPLTPQQMAAVQHPPGRPARILAGAGTGKTRVIVARFHHLVDAGVRPERILALTFSREAARQMRDEIVRQLAAGAGLWVSTFHAFCLRVLEEGLAERPRLVQAAESRSILAALQAAGTWQWYREGRATRMVDEAYELIGHAKDQLLSPEQVAAYALEQNDLRLQDLARLYGQFQAELEQQRAADFSDYILRAVRLLESDPALLRRWRDRFDHILVDEFQDTNLAQFQVLKLLAQEHRNLMVVGDDDQAIYRFRGATDRFIRSFATEMGGADSYTIEENFRCPAPVLSVANQLIQQNGAEREPKELRTTIKLHGYPQVAHWVGRNEREEAEAVAAEIARRLRAEPRRKAGDFAILCRSVRRSGEEFIRALSARAVPCRLASEEHLHPVAAQTLALLRLTVRESQGDLLQVLASMVEPAELYAAFRSGQVAELPAAQWVAAWLEACQGRPVPELVYEALLFLGHLRLTLTPSAADAERLDAARRLQEQAAAAATLDDLLAQASSEGGGGASAVAASGDAVTIMTVNAAKGLQFPVVFVVGLAEGRFPIAVDAAPVFYTAEAIRAWADGDAAARELTAAERQAQHWKEERRLAYVALTRAEEELILTRAATYGTEPAAPSRFLAEMGAPAAEPVGGRLGDPVPEARHFLVQVAAGEERAAADLVVAAAGVLRAEPGAVPLRRQAEPSPFAGGESLSLSATALEQYRDCPRKYYYSRVVGLPDEDSVYLAFGDALHAALERLNRARMAGPSPGWAELEAWWEEALEPGRFELNAQYRQFLERGRTFLQRYHGWALAQPHQVVAVEQGFSVPYTDRAGRTHTIRGRYDLIVKGSGGLEIIDYKSGHRKSTGVNKQSRKGSANNPDRKLQLGLYYLAHFGDTPLDGARVTYVFLRHPDDQPPHTFVPEFNHQQEQVISAVHTRESLQAIRADVDDVIEGILANNFPRNVDDWTCASCPFRTPCEVSNREWF